MFAGADSKRFTLFSTLVAAVLLPSLPALVAANQTCYYPDSSVASGDTPCGNGTNVACCGTGSICLSNGLCMDVSQPYSLARSSCTDKTWSSGGCPNYCLQDSNFNSSGCSIVLFTYLDSVGRYCCNNIVASDNEPVCASNHSTFQITDSTIVPGYALLSNYELNSTSNSTNSSDTTSSSNCSIASNSSSTQSGSSNNHDVAIGAGVGVPLGLIALASIAWALWERRKLNRYRSQTPTSAEVKPSPISDASQQPMYPVTSTTYSNASQPQAYPVVNTTAGNHNMPMDASAYGSPAQAYNQPLPLSEMATRGPVELDSQRK